jgi:hypothetical protein
MLNNLRNLEGVTVLSKKEQKDVKGGETCIIKLKEGIYSMERVIKASFNATGAAASAAANDYCVGKIMQGYESCGYDCEHDGYSGGTLDILEMSSVG